MVKIQAGGDVGHYVTVSSESDIGRVPESSTEALTKLTVAEALAHGGESKPCVPATNEAIGDGDETEDFRYDNAAVFNRHGQ